MFTTLILGCIISSSIPVTVADGVGLIGWGKTMYRPACAAACRSILKRSELSCTPKDGHHLYGTGHSTTATSPECYTSDPAFMRTMALCMDTYCPGSDNPPLSVLDEYWAGHLGTVTVGDTRWKPVVSYTEALEAAREDEKQASNSSSQEAQSSTRGRKRGDEDKSPLPVAISKEPLNTTSVVDETDWQLQYNGLTSFEINERGHSTYTITAMLVALLLPVAVSSFRFVPAITRNPAWTWLNSVLILPPLWGTRHRRPIASYLGGGIMPTIGQTLYISLISFLNFILLVAPTHTIQPQSVFPTLRQQEISVIGNRAGVLAMGNTVALIVFSSRNNALLYVTDWSHGTFLLLHRWLGYWAIFHSALHSVMLWVFYDFFGDYKTESATLYWKWGIVSTVAVCVLWPASLLVVRQRFYEAFLAIHQVFALVFLIGYYYHIWYRFEYNWGYEIWMFIACGIWSLDRLIRLARIAFQGRKTAVISNIEGSDGEYMRIEVHDASVQDIVYICFPTLSWKFWETHPFSVLSSTAYEERRVESDDQQMPHAQVTLEKEPIHDIRSPDPISPVKVKRATFLVRVRSGFSRKLSDRVKAANGRVSMPILLEGSYKSSTYSQLSQCKSLLCIAGGAGITTVLPILQASQSRPARLFWGLRNDSLRDGMSSLLDALPENVDVTTKVGERLDIAAIVEEELKVQTDVKGLVGVVVSGPPGMADDVRMAVAAIGRSQARQQFVFIDEGFSW